MNNLEIKGMKKKSNEVKVLSFNGNYPVDMELGKKIITDEGLRIAEYEAETDPEKRFHLYKQFHFDKLCDIAYSFPFTLEVKAKMWYCLYTDFWDSYQPNDIESVSVGFTTYKQINDYVVKTYKEFDEIRKEYLLRTVEVIANKPQREKMKDLNKFKKKIRITRNNKNISNELSEALKCVKKRIDIEIDYELSEIEYELKLQTVANLLPQTTPEADSPKEYRYFEEVEEGLYLIDIDEHNIDTIELFYCLKDLLDFSGQRRITDLQRTQRLIFNKDQNKSNAHYKTLKEYSYQGKNGTLANLKLRKEVEQVLRIIEFIQ